MSIELNKIKIKWQNYWLTQLFFLIRCPSNYLFLALQAPSTFLFYLSDHFYLHQIIRMPEIEKLKNLLIYQQFIRKYNSPIYIKDHTAPI